MHGMVITLQVPGEPGAGPAFTSAEILPGRGMMTLQVRARLPRLGEIELLAPPSREAVEILERDEDGFPANQAYKVGGAILIPYANRIRGELSADGRTIETRILDREVRLPANASGGPGRERYSMHGLVLDAQAENIERRTTEDQDSVRGTIHAGDFGHGWPSKTEIVIENLLRSDAFVLTIEARNVGDETLPIGIGWHPYFALPSGRRQPSRLRIPARRRTLVNDYAEVLPTGEVVAVAGTEYDFSQPGGREMGDQFLDDCFVDLERTPAGEAVTEVIDPESGLGVRVIAATPRIQAFQVYAPPAKNFLVVEPQFNWADPFGPQWASDVDTGMAQLAPGESVIYSARLELFTP
jgi:aldose 1-epimerase